MVVTDLRRGSRMTVVLIPVCEVVRLCRSCGIHLLHLGKRLAHMSEGHLHAVTCLLGFTTCIYLLLHIFQYCLWADIMVYEIPFSKEYWINPFSLSHITLFRPMWGWSPSFLSICLISTEIQSLYFRFLISRVLGFIGIAIQLHSQKLQLFVRGPFSSFLFTIIIIKIVYTMTCKPSRIYIYRFAWSLYSKYTIWLTVPKIRK